MTNLQLKQSGARIQVLKVRKEYQSTAFDKSLINNLLKSLDDRKILYCHWKSNWRIDRWLKGDGDLDLLVSRRDVGEFTAILSELGFKKALTPPEKDVPGILNFYGFDRETQKFIHVHAHYQLVLGHDYTKNYRLPVEEKFLSGAIRHKNIYIASPEMELIFFIVRMVLKFSTPEYGARSLLGKLKRYKREIKSEIDHLETQISESKLQSILQENFPMIGQELFNDCRESLKTGAGIRQKISVKRKLEKSISAYTRSSRLAEVFTKYQRGIFQAARKFSGFGMKRKKFENGGALIAIVGGDGSGKTTAVNGLHNWLSKKFIARKVHLGKPPKSFSTLVVGAALKINRRLFGTGDGSEKEHLDQGFWQHLRWVCTARDRFKLYRKIRRSAANGEIVICDRYPIPGLNLMDNPKISAISEKKEIKKSSRFLSRIEKGYYEQITPPDELFVLRVKPETAVIRKKDEAALHVFTRSEELWKFDWKNKGAHLIDANQTAEEVLGHLQSEIWKVI